MSKKFMSKHIVKGEATQSYNIQSMIKKEFYHIDEKSINKFSKSLGFILEKDNEMGLHYLFRPPNGNQITQFRFDIDLISKGEQKPEKRLYTEEQIKQTISVINAEIECKVEGIKENNLISCLLTKDMYFDEEKKRWKNGIHIQYPFLFLENYEIVNLVKSINKRLTNIFSEEFFTPDNGFPKNGWLVYGCNKKGEKDRYKCDTFYDSYCRKIDDSFMTDKVKLFWLYPLDKKFIFKFKIDDIREEKEGEKEDEDEDEENEVGTSEEKNGRDEDFIFEKLNSLSQKRVEETKYWRVVVSSVYKFSKSKNLNMAKVFKIVDEWSQKTDIGNYCFEGLKRLWNFCEEDFLSSGDKNRISEIGRAHV